MRLHRMRNHRCLSFQSQFINHDGPTAQFPTGWRIPSSKRKIKQQTDKANSSLFSKNPSIIIVLYSTAALHECSHPGTGLAWPSLGKTRMAMDRNHVMTVGQDSCHISFLSNSCVHPFSQIGWVELWKFGFQWTNWAAGISYSHVHVDISIPRFPLTIRKLSC